MMAKKKTTTKSSGAKRAKSGKRKTTKKKARGVTFGKRPKKPEAQRPLSIFQFADATIESKLKTGHDQSMLESGFGTTLYPELRNLTNRTRVSSRRAGQRVWILPSMMGSRLGTDLPNSERKDRFDPVWLDPFHFEKRDLDRLNLSSSTTVRPIGVMLHAYLIGKLRLELAGFEVRFYPFDWRKSIDLLGKQLARDIEKETGKGTDQGSNQFASLSLYAHGMGGLVARRALKILDDKQQINRVHRVVMTGTPNFGTFAPIPVLQGRHPIVGKLAELAQTKTRQLCEQTICEFPGVIELLPFPDRQSNVDLFKASSWSDQHASPSQSKLTAAKRIHNKLYAPPHNDGRCVVIAGVDQPTITDLQLKDESFTFLQSPNGDGTVPVECAQLPNATTYYVKKSHGQLPGSIEVIRAAIDIFEIGRTDQLSHEWERRHTTPTPTEIEPFEPAMHQRPQTELFPEELRSLLDDFLASPIDDHAATPASTAMVLAPSLEPINISRQRQHQISLQLAEGDIATVNARAAVLGIFQDVDPAGPSERFDKLLGGTVSEFVSRNMFSANVGEVFILPTGRQLLALEFVVFAGLGRFNQFTESTLKVAAENVARTLVRSKVDDFAFVLMGTASGIGIPESVTNMLEGLFKGILEANEHERLSRITICEYTPSRYLQIRSEVLKLATTPLFDPIEVTIREVESNRELRITGELEPSLKRPSTDHPEPIYLFVQDQGQSYKFEPNSADHLNFQLSLLGPTDHATVISESIRISQSKLDRLLSRTDRLKMDTLKKFGSELANLVLPPEIIAILAEMDDRELVIIHDAEASRIPWETMVIDDNFVSVHQGISRKYAAENLSIGKWLDSRKLEDKIHVLLIVDPMGDLPAAQIEGDRLLKSLGSAGGIRVTELRGQDATWNQIRAELRSGQYDVVHYAGHAYFDSKKRANSGIYCHGGQILSGTDLACLERLPALAFFNACQAGRVRGITDTKAEVRQQIDVNVGLAEAFLRGGVANYVGTHWKVNDDVAETFATEFYTKLLRGQTTASAMRECRDLIQNGNQYQHEFANYIHYGNPFFVLKVARQPRELTTRHD